MTRSRAGMSLIEIMVVIAVLAIVTAVAVPTLQSVYDLEQRGAARDMATTYKFLLNEAAMRNVTFRIAYDLDGNTWQVEVGDPDTLIFSTPDAREEYEKQREKDLRRFDKEAQAEAEAAAEQRFAGLTMPGFESKQALPSNSMFAFVYTPQYGEPRTPSTEERDEDDPPNVAYSYIFANGEAEYTVVRIVSVDDPEDGYSVEVEPISGAVSVDSDLRDIGAGLAWLPDEAPDYQ